MAKGHGLLIVIAHYRTPGLCEECLVSLEPEVKGLGDVQVVVTDVGSADGSAERLSAFVSARGFGGWCSVEPLPRNGGYAYGNNEAIRPRLLGEGGPQYVLLLNPDTVIRPGALLALMRFVREHPDVHVAGARLENPDGSSQLAARRFPTPMSELDSSARVGVISTLLGRWRTCPPEPSGATPCGWTPGAALLFSREALDKVGLLDEGYFMYFEEVDLCLRANRAGMPCWYVPESRVVHLVGQSSGATVAKGRPRRLPAYWFESRRRYYLKNHGRLTLLLADIGVIVGTLLHRAVCLVRGRTPSDAPGFLRDLLTHRAGRPTG